MPYLTLALLLYVMLDFGNPLMPGAVSFDPNESVDATRGGEIRGHQEVISAPSTDSTRFDIPDDTGQLSIRRRSQARHSRLPFRPLRRTLLRPADPVCSSDDH